MEGGGKSSVILNVISRWRRMVSIMVWALSSWSPCCPLIRRLGCKQTWSGCCGKKNLYLSFSFLDSYIAAVWMVTNIPEEFLACAFAACRCSAHVGNTSIHNAAVTHRAPCHNSQNYSLNLFFHENCEC